jgi:hypothetical protein
MKGRRVERWKEKKSEPGFTGLRDYQDYKKREVEKMRRSENG